MTAPLRPAAADPIPAWHLYGEDRAFPDVLHVERVTDRAAGLDWRIAPHRHLHLHQIFLIRAGSVALALDGVRSAPVPPVVLNVPRGTVHGFVFAAGTDGLVITLPLAALPEVFDPAGPLDGPLGRAAAVAPPPGFDDLAARLAAEHAARAPFRPALLRALATEACCRVARALGPGADGAGAGADPRFARFEDLIGAHCREGWQVADYARALGLSARHLARLCRAATGRSPAAHVADAAMREACRLLVYTRAPVASVGYALGFEDPSYFTRAFRRHMGVTPRAYRAAFDGEELPDEGPAASASGGAAASRTAAAIARS